jgi:hypothetical protein
MSVRRLKAEMTVKELAEWQALYALEAEERERSQRNRNALDGAQQARAQARGGR